LKTTKPFDISKETVWLAWERVKANKGAAGADGETIEQFESNLQKNLYKLWNRMSSGCYFPSPVKRVSIPKKDGGERNLNIPSVKDRIAQTVAKMYLEPKVEPYFHENSYGYRPKKSAHQALEITRKRCWRYDWVLEFDIKGLFDNIDRKLLMKAVLKHTDNRWVILYIERWLVTPIRLEDGAQIEQDKGIPQGGVISPVLSNLFLHYVFDKWMENNFPNIPFCRYADDGLSHHRSEAEALRMKEALEERLQECGLEMHPDKTKIIYCKDSDRREKHPVTSFDFLGYTFRPRGSKNRNGKFFINFSPAMSDKAGKAIRQEVRGWKLHARSDKSLTDLSRMFKANIQGWINYYGRFYKSGMYSTLRHINHKLTVWATRKFKKRRGHRRRAEHWLGEIAKKNPGLFPHWKLGVRPMVG
jgi:RNA-directed DNA polymerase